MSDRLQPNWLAWPETQALIAVFAPQGDVLRFVGGAVRDALLGRVVKDVDAATSLSPEQVMALLAQAHLQAIPTGIKHGTVTALVAAKPFEITTLRRDTACDGRHAQVEFTHNWQEDAARRDFTMNALYLSPEGALFDYFGGRADAQAGRVRFIGDAHARVREDYLRILRFYRFHAHYGAGMPDADAVRACEAGAGQLAHISGERIQSELLKLLSAAQASATLALMQRGGVLAHALGIAPRGLEVFARLESIAALGVVPALPPESKLAGFVLPADDAEPSLAQLGKRLRLPLRVEKTLRSWLPYVPQMQRNIPPAEQKHLLRLLGAGPYTALVQMGWALGEDDITIKSPYIGMMRLAKEWQPPLFPVSGADLMEAGIPPGRVMGDMLRQLQDMWERADYRLSKDELLAKARAAQARNGE